MKRLVALTVVLALLVVACSSGSTETVASIVAREANLSNLENALNTADLTDLFADPNGEYTLFAPTDEAFTAFGTLPEGDALARVLYYHALSEKLSATDLRSSAPGMLETIEGSLVTIIFEEDKILLNGTAELVTTDLEASNGVVHIVDKVIISPTQTN